MTIQTKTTMPDRSRETKAGWRKVKLGEVITPVLGGTPSRAVRGYWNGNIKWISIQDIINADGRYIRKTAETINEDGVKNSPAKILPKDSIIISARGTVGELAMLAEPMAFNQSCYGLVPKNPKEINQIYLFYALKDIIRKAKKIAHGGVFDTFTKDTFDYIDFEYPKNIDTQKRIANILSAFDDKIELNNQISAVLEQMAQAIFKEWFIKKSKCKNQNAKLWKVKNVMEIVKRILVGKKYDNKTALPVGKVPILDQGQSGYIGYHNDEPGVMASIDEPVVVFTNHTCNYQLMTRPFSTIQNVLPYIGINGYPTIFVYYLTRGRITMQEYKGHWPEFEQQEFLVPPPELAVEFAFYVKSMVQKMVEIEYENQKLAALRNLLLPKLMSGEIRV